MTDNIQFNPADKLRKELEEKIDKKMPKDIVIWVTGILAVVIMGVLTKAFNNIDAERNNANQTKEHLIQIIDSNDTATKERLARIETRMDSLISNNPKHL